MPFINVKTNTAVSDEKKTAIKSELGQAISLIPGKSESWLMVGIEPEHVLYFKGDDAPAAMVEVSVYGQENPAAFNMLTEKICNILNEQLSIEQSRIYVKYDATGNWGWNGSNF
ncbi:phenylpyruvate tautomerase MIF-related protein [Porcipelethomonas sp.]|uniref:phenylpyruvate tautomerase MIF-related protein n=1 Tax=Porcipelethomonas sp. TaxID=2981675 RepID=UPI003EF8A8B8